MARPLAEIEAELQKPFSGPISHSDRRDDAPYIAKDDLVKELHDVFGTDGWARRTVATKRDGDTIIATVEFTYYPTDSAPRTQGRTGTSPIRTTKQGYEMLPLAYGAAATAALKSCVKDYPRFAILDEEREDRPDVEDVDDNDRRPARKPSRGSGGGGSGGGRRNDDDGPTPSQTKWLKKAGYTSKDIDGMSKQEASKALDAYFKKDKGGSGGSSKSRSSSRPAQMDDDDDLDDNDDD